MSWLLQVLWEGFQDLSFIFVRPEDAKSHPINNEVPVNIAPAPQNGPVAQIPLTPKQIVCQAAIDALGKDLTPDNVAAEVRCVAQLMAVLNKTPYGLHMPITYTPYLFNVLKAHPQWRATLTPSAGCIILSPTIDDAHEGHTGLFISDSRIASNNSYGPNAGKWTDNYSYMNWVSAFRGIGLHVYIFEPV